MLYRYFKHGGIFLFVVFLILFIFYIQTSYFVNMVFGAWAENTFKTTHITYIYLILCFIGFLLLLILLIAIMISKFANNSSYETVKTFTHNLLRKNLQFFDSTPIGSILTLSSRDSNLIDFNVP